MVKSDNSGEPGFISANTDKKKHPFYRMLSPGDNNNIVQLDLVIICDSRKLDEQGYKGAPDLVIEIISPFIQEKIVYHYH